MTLRPPGKAPRNCAEIRRLNAADSIQELTSLLHRAYAPLAAMGLRYMATHQSNAVTRERVASGECWVALEGGAVVGTILVKEASRTSGSPWLDRPEVASFGQLAVLPEWQGTGLGARLMDLAERRAAETGAQEIALDTAEPAKHLVTLYNRCGYRIVEHVQWSHTNYRSVIMSKPIRTSVVIRPACAEDGAAVVAIYAPYVRETAVSFETEPPTGDVMTERISSTLLTHPWLVAEREGVVVGFAYAGKHSQRPGYRWTVDVTVYVGTSERRSGIGRQLYAVLLDTLRKQGFRSAFAEIVVPNPGSTRLHEVMGFRHVGVHHDIGYKLGSWHDIAYWRLGLSADSKPPREPIPFVEFRKSAEFDTILVHTRQGDYRSVVRDQG